MFICAKWDGVAPKLCGGNLVVFRLFELSHIHSCLRTINGLIGVTNKPTKCIVTFWAKEEGNCAVRAD